MKTSSTFLLIALLLTGCYTAHCAPGDAKTNSITLQWDPRAPEEYITHYNLYVRNDFPPGMPQTNAPLGETMTWTPTVEDNILDVDNWTLLTTITNLAEDATLLNVTNVTVSLTNKAMFFVVTANNGVSESFFSNVAWKPAIPSQTNRLWASSVD